LIEAAVWHSSNGILHMNEVILCQARQYKDGWPSSGGHTILVCNQPPRPTQPPTLSGT